MSDEELELELEIVDPEEEVELELEEEVELELEEEVELELDPIPDDELELEEVELDLDPVAEGDIDLDLGMDIELSEGVELDYGFGYTPIADTTEFDDDLVLAALSESSSSAVSNALRIEQGKQANQEELLLLELDDDIVIDTEEEEPKYEVALTPAQNALAIYQPREDESAQIQRRIRDIHNIIYRPEQYIKSANDKINEYLSSDKMSTIPVSSSFTSPEYSKQQNFKSLLTADFHNHWRIPNDFPVEVIISRVIKVYETEYKVVLSEFEKSKMASEVKEFIAYATSIFNESYRQKELATYVEREVPVECPQLVGNFEYVCKCGESYPMPENRPTMTFLIEGKKTPKVIYMPSQVYCKKCKVGLELMHDLTERIQEAVVQHILQINGLTFENPRIYRPKIDDLMQMIPADVHELFDLRAGNAPQHDADNTNQTAVSFVAYKKLITMWMDSEISETHLEEVVSSFSETTDLVPLVKQISSVDFSFVPDIESYQFTRTLIYFLENSAAFAITKRGLALHRYHEIEGYNRKVFPVDYAIEWIYDNAPFLASLNNLFDGDTEMEDLYILPEYTEAINYVVGLHLLANDDVLRPKTNLSKWSQDPSSKITVIDKLYKELKTPDNKRLATSYRDLYKTPESYSMEAWRNTYQFAREVIGPRRYNSDVSPECKELARQAMRQSESDFYGEELPDNMLVRPSLRFDDFMVAFKEFGYLLFTGPIVNEKRKNLAKGLELYLKAGRLDEVLKSHEKPVNDVSGILLSSSEDDVDVNELVVELIIRESDLPDDLNEIREKYGYKELLKDFRDVYADRFLSDEAVMKKYGEVFSCYL